MLPKIASGRAATLEEVAEYLGLTQRVVRNIVRKHAVPALDTGAQLRFDELAFNALLEALRSRALAAAARIPKPYKMPVSSGYQKLGESQYDAVLRRLTLGSQKKRQQRAIRASKPLGRTDA